MLHVKAEGQGALVQSEKSTVRFLSVIFGAARVRVSGKIIQDVGRGFADKQLVGSLDKRYFLSRRPDQAVLACRSSKCLGG